MTNSIKFSVIIPVYNVQDYLSECLDSIVGQTLKDIEIICVDNGSVDKSLEILKKYAKRDKRIKILEIGRSNAGAARNAGLAMANGEFLYFIDSDDYCETDLLEKCYIVFRLSGLSRNLRNELKKSKKIYTIAQDEDTCVVYGMPRAIAEAGCTDEVVPLDNIASQILKHVGVK